MLEIWEIYRSAWNTRIESDRPWIDQQQQNVAEHHKSPKYLCRYPMVEPISWSCRKSPFLMVISIINHKWIWNHQSFGSSIISGSSIINMDMIYDVLNDINQHFHGSLHCQAFVQFSFRSMDFFVAICALALPGKPGSPRTSQKTMGCFHEIHGVFRLPSGKHTKSYWKLT